MMFHQSPGVRHHAQSARGSSRPTTGHRFTWASTGVRNSHVVSVGRCWLRGDTGLNTPSLVFMVRGLHALCVGKLFASAQTMHKHHKAQHGADSVVPEGGFICPFCSKSFRVRKTWSEHKPYCSENPDRKGPYFCRVVGCLMSEHPFPHMRNLNVHMSNAHGWKERKI